VVGAAGTCHCCGLDPPPLNPLACIAVGAPLVGCCYPAVLPPLPLLGAAAAMPVRRLCHAMLAARSVVQPGVLLARFLGAQPQRSAVGHCRPHAATALAALRSLASRLRFDRSDCGPFSDKLGSIWRQCVRPLQCNARHSPWSLLQFPERSGSTRRAAHFAPGRQVPISRASRLRRQNTMCTPRFRNGHPAVTLLHTHAQGAWCRCAGTAGGLAGLLSMLAHPPQHATSERRKPWTRAGTFAASRMYKKGSIARDDTRRCTTPGWLQAGGTGAAGPCDGGDDAPPPPSPFTARWC